MMENEIILALCFLNIIGLFLTLIKINSLEYTLKRYIPFYWLYYIIKMNIKKQWILCWLKRDIYNIENIYNVLYNNTYYYFLIEINKKTINKIKQL